MRELLGIFLLFSCLAPAKADDPPASQRNYRIFQADLLGNKGDFPAPVQRQIERTEEEIHSNPGRTRDEVLAQNLPGMVPPLISDQGWSEPARPARVQAENAVGLILTDLASRSNPGSAEAYYRDASALADHVLSHDQDNRDALNNRAASQYGLGANEKAIADATFVVRLDPNNERAYTTRALAHYEMKDYPRAMADAERVLSINPNNRVAFQVAQLAKTRVKTAEDLHLGRGATAIAGKVDREYSAWKDQRNRIEGERAPAQEAASDQLAGLLDNARRRIKLDDYPGARKVLDDALRREPGSAEAYYLRAVVDNLENDWQEADNDATRALSRDPDHVGALDARASALNSLSRWQAAERDASRSIVLKPESAWAYKHRALARERLGNLTGMILDLQAAAVRNPQFQEELKEAMARHSLSLALAASPEAETLPMPAPPPARRWKRILTIVGISLSGGLLIALGLVSVLGPRGGSPEQDKILAAGYKIVKTIGNGGMGVVYEAEDKSLGRKVAIKKMRDEIRSDPRERARFLEEARIVASLDHPNIVAIHAILEEAEQVYLVFEHVQGRTLDEIIARGKRVGLVEAARITSQVCAALDFAHRRGIVHRDLKPSNVMLSDHGLVKVMDFGIARQAKDALAKSTSTQTIVGTPLYMAPEQEAGIVRPESDLYSLGACLYEMVTGNRPFPAQAATESKKAKSYAKPSRVTPLPAEVDALIDAALEPDPEKRIRSAAEFAARLKALIAHVTPQVSGAKNNS